MKHLTSVLVLSSLVLGSYAQVPDTAEIRRLNDAAQAHNEQFFARMQVEAFYTGKEIRLRWAPDAPGAWLNGNLKGYVVQRVDLGQRNDTTVELQGWESVGADSVIRQLSIPEWKALSTTYPDDDYIMMAGGMIAAAHDEENIGFNPNFVEAADQLKQRFSFTLLAADLSFNAAQGAGLGISDNNVQKGHEYMYRVYLPGLKNYPVDTGYAYISAREPSELYEPLIKRIEEGDDAVTLVWDREAHDKRFTAYIIERSSDGGNSYTRLNDKPYIAFTNPDLPGTQNNITYTDSLSVQYVRYHYRVTGLNMFGLESRRSNVVSGMARDKTPPASPTQVRAVEERAGEITVTWDYPAEETDLNGFYVLRGGGVYEDYMELNKKPLPRSTRTFVDKAPVQHEQNYYLVVAVDTAKNAGISLSAWGALVDSIPPAAPKGLAGTIDSTGIVNLSWNLGPEPDIYGYYVFVRNQSDHVGARITLYPIRDTTFTDTVSMRTLTEEIYYEVVALDMNKNNSKPSEQLELKRPDLKVPVSPLLVDYTVSAEGILLKWANSSSQDVVEQILLRREDKSLPWDTIKRFEPSNDAYTTYLEKDPGTRREYQFAVIARDDAGLWSPIANTFTLRTLSDGRIKAVKKLNAKFLDEKKLVELAWDYAEVKEIQFVILKSTDGTDFQRVKMLPASGRKWTDRLVKEGQEYSYYIQVIDPNGPDSNYSPQAKVKL